MLVFALLVVVRQAPAAETGGLTLGTARGAAGAEARLPIYVTLAKDHQFERITAIIEYPQDLAFRQLRASDEGVTGNVTAHAKELPAQPTDKTKRLEVSFQAETGKLLPGAGILARLIFAVKEKAKPQIMTLPVRDASGFRKGGGAVVKVRGDPGGVTIYEEGLEPQPVMPCFFFTH